MATLNHNTSESNGQTRRDKKRARPKEAASAVHTPGPWRMRPSIGDGGHFIIEPQSGRGENIACVRRRPGDANAKLIVAAPDLLQWLKVLLDQVDYARGACGPTEMISAVLPTSAISQARAAITKAEGIAS